MMLELELMKNQHLTLMTEKPKRGLRRYGKLLEDSDFGIGKKPKRRKIC